MSVESIRAFGRDVVSLKWYMAVSVALFFIGIGIGAQSEWLNRYLAEQIEPLRETVLQLETMDNKQLMMFLFIFFNNFIKSLLVVFLGALFGLFPIYFLVLNGMIVGFITAVAGDAGMDVAAMVVRGILPHGILEITAIIIAAAYGLKYGVLVMKELVLAIRGRRTASGLKAFHGTLKRLIAFLFFALLAAAFIESTITYFLVRG